MNLKTQAHPRIVTYDAEHHENGALIPVYNIHDGFYEKGEEPQQVYLTIVAPGQIKGPHLHYVRRGCFTCIKGNVRVVVKVDGQYQTYCSGEDNNYLSIQIPVGLPAAIQNIGSEEAWVVNMPYPAWTADMNDEHSADFSDFDFSIR
jgi:dTDP-4-dehydrorhamnose 3,5-epimerase